MKYLLIFLMLIIAASCGGDRPGPSQGHTPPPPVDTPTPDGYIPVSQAIITIKQQEDTVAMKTLKMFNPISVAYAASESVTVTYVQAENSTMTLNTTALVPSMSTDGNTLDLGSITISDLRANKLKICGAGGNEKCTSAIIRIYTQELVGFAGIGGFVNKTDGYGIDTYAGKSTADTLVGLTSTNAATVQSYTIPSSDNKINLSDFPSPTYLMEVDFSNGGAGSYEMTIIVELALGS